MVFVDFDCMYEKIMSKENIVIFTKKPEIIIPKKEKITFSPL